MGRRREIILGMPDSIPDKTMILGSKKGGHLAIQENAAPLDMSTKNVPEQQFLLNVIRLIADEEQWQ